MFRKRFSLAVLVLALAAAPLFLGGCGIFNIPPEVVIEANPIGETADLAFSFTVGQVSGNGTIISAKWSFGDGTTGQGLTTTHSYPTSGEFKITVTVTDDNCETGSDTQIINVLNPGPTCDGIHIQNQTGRSSISPYDAGDTLIFSAIDARHPAYGRTIKKYKWNFGDGTTDYGSTTGHSYDYPGTYTVTLTLIDDLGVSNRVPITTSFAIQEYCCLPDIHISYCDDPCFNVGCPITFYGNFGDGRCNWCCSDSELKGNVLEAKSLITPKSCCNPCPPCPGDPCPDNSCRDGTWEWRIWLNGNPLSNDCGRFTSVIPWEKGEMIVYLFYTCGGKSTYDCQSYQIGG